MRPDGTTILFGLPGVRVREVERAADGTRVVHVLTDDDGAAACPQCGVLSSAVRQLRTTRPRDIPYGQTPLVVRWHKRQYACRQSACPRKAFTEQIAEVPAGSRLTGRLRRHLAERVAQGLPVTVAAAGLVSWPIAHGAFVALAEQVLREPEPTAVLGIDETRRGRPTWIQRADGRWRLTERFETNFVDLADSSGLLGQTAGRTSKAVVDWLEQRSPAWRDAVRIVAMDPCASYRAAVRAALPGADDVPGRGVSGTRVLC